MRDLLDRTLGDGVKVTVEDKTSDWAIFGDRTQMENAILNTAVNARDAMDGRGELTIRTAETRVAQDELPRAVPGDYVVISVTDTGAGMTPEVAERVFEPFFTTKPAGKGTGTGLSQIFGLVGQLGGDVTIRTAPGAGTTVNLYFPRHVALAPTLPPSRRRPRKRRPRKRMHCASCWSKMIHACWRRPWPRFGNWDMIRCHATIRGRPKDCLPAIRAFA